MYSPWDLGGLRWWELVKRVWREIGEDAILGQAARLAFYFLLSMFPLLVSLEALLGYFIEDGARVHQALLRYLAMVAPGSTPGLIETSLREVGRGPKGGRLWFGLLVALWIGSSGVVAIMTALNRAYEIDEARPWWKRRLVAIVLTVVLLVLMTSALLLIVYGGDLAGAMAARAGANGLLSTLWTFLQWPLALAFVALAFNLLYLYAPNLEHWDWHWLMPGTVVAVGLWLSVSLAFKFYVSSFGTYRATYGSMATAVVLILWFYFTGIALLIGGQVNSEIERAAGKVGPA